MFKTRTVIVAAALSLGIGLLGAQAGARHTAAKPGPMRVVIGFEGTVYQGPDRGLSLRGPLTLQVSEPNGMVVGSLAAGRAGTVPASGHFKYQAVNLIFTLPNGAHVYGVGTFSWDSRVHNFAIGGPLVGPRAADFGDWAVAVPCVAAGCTSTSSTISCGVITGNCVPTPAPTARATATPLPQPSPAPNPQGGSDDTYNMCVHDGNDPFYCLLHS